MPSDPLTCPDCQKPLKPKKAWGGELACFCRWKGRKPSAAQLDRECDLTRPSGAPWDKQRRIKAAATDHRWTAADIPPPKPVEALTLDELSVELIETIRAGRNGCEYDRPRLRALSERFASFL